MDLLLLIFSSIAIGIAVTAPIGPINLMVIRTSLKNGFWSGVWVGFGSVLGDGFFAAVAAFGLSALFSFFEGFAIWLQIGGGVFMIGYGCFVLFFSKEKNLHDQSTTPKKIIGNFAPIGTTFFLTLTNPATMLGFIGLFGALSGIVEYSSTYLRSSLVVIGVMTGSLIWISSLSAFISWIHRSLSKKAITNINLGTGIALIVFGGVVLGRLLIAI